MSSVHVLAGVLASLTLPRLPTFTLEHNIDDRCLLGCTPHSWAWHSDTEFLGVLSAVRGLETLVFCDGYAKFELHDCHSTSSTDNECAEHPLLSPMLLSRLSHFQQRGLVSTPLDLFRAFKFLATCGT
ncbi:hypothetical protein B0H19DRAFT_1271066 [Mycena capillaripes]|nr:hypothetical protein B0H19DRAFT_1271066 [Mycena capillaripes]